MATSQVGGLPLFSDTTATEVAESTASGILKAVSGLVSAISLAGNSATKFLNEQGAFTDPAEHIRDTIGVALVAGTNITITVSDAGDTITIDASGGGSANVLATVEPVPRYNFLTSPSAYPSANLAHFYKFRPANAVTVSAIQFETGVASPTGNVDVGIYDSADGGVTLTRLASSGSTAFSAGAGVKSINLSAPLALVTGKDYWMAIACDNTTDTFARVVARATIMAAQNRLMTKASSFPLPSSATTFATSANIYYLGAL